MADEEQFTPRNYQVKLVDIALKTNTIIYLPTGSGKTFIAVMVLNRMSESLKKTYSEGGKITIILVNTIALVPQHKKYITMHTIFKAGCYTGEMNLDNWTKEKWEGEFNKSQVIIMTSQIMVNLINNYFIDLRRVNLIVFDECHRGVEDQPMRQIMKAFQNYQEQPRVLGLTATLLNGNCKLTRVMDEVRALETTFHGKVATVDGLEHVVGYSTNPQEIFKFFKTHQVSKDEIFAINLLNKVVNVLHVLKLEEVSSPKRNIDMKNFEPLEPVDVLKRLRNFIKDLIIHIEMLGPFGGYKAAIAYMIQVERLRKHCEQMNTFTTLNYILTVFGCVKEVFKKAMSQYSEVEKLERFSSDQVLKLFEILKEYKTKSNEDLCALIFVKRRFTAKVVYHIIECFAKCHPDMSHIKANFMVGNANNPLNDTRENLFISKKNKEVLESFVNKEVNVLVSSNVLEEGVDIPKCTLVVKFDKYEDYRSYVQSKGRARHKSSLYYTLVGEEGTNKFFEKFENFQQIETILTDCGGASGGLPNWITQYVNQDTKLYQSANFQLSATFCKFLVGKTNERQSPSEIEINNMYSEDEIAPYFVDGPNSAQVNMISAIPLLCRYCSSLPADQYTEYAPDWYLDKCGTSGKIQVVILLPIICPIKEPIRGPPMLNKKNAKRAAALVACIALHKCGELDDCLLPSVKTFKEDTTFLFKHWPEVKEPDGGIKKNKRLHDKEIPDCLLGSIKDTAPVYLHVVHLNPQFRRSEDCNQSILYDLYKSKLRFGFLTPKPLKSVCNFPLYDSNGEIDVTIEVNVKTVNLTKHEIVELREFHHLIFNDVIEVINEKPYLVFDNSGTRSDMLLTVPIRINGVDVAIDFDVVSKHKSIKNPQLEPTLTDKLRLTVTEEDYLHAIVSPWYRPNSAMYVVTTICFDKSPLSSFPNDDFSNFAEYYNDKHARKIHKLDQPLLLVRGLSKKLNMYKPKGREAKRRKDQRFEESDEYLIPELVVKQDFPSSLWIQARLLPSILSRLTYLLKLQKLQITIARELDLNQDVHTLNAAPLELDLDVINYNPDDKIKFKKFIIESQTQTGNLLPLECTRLVSQTCNKDYASKMLESEYPWKNIDEPKDIERHLNVTVVDIEHYEVFISQKVSTEERVLSSRSPVKLPAITYPPVEFREKSLAILSVQFNNQSPSLREIHRAMTSAEANDIVNLERLETLGDSFLKLISSLYIMFKFPNYNEGNSTLLKGRLVSNKNLFYLASRKNLGGIMKNCDFSPKEEWMPPGYCIPASLNQKILQKEISIACLFDCAIPFEEQISGNVSKATLRDLKAADYPVMADENSLYPTMCHFINKQYVSDKTIADGVEALLGAYFQSGGIIGGIKFLEWIDIIPPSEKLQELIENTNLNPILDPHAGIAEINFHVPQWQNFEERLGYRFQNRGFLLQALTHASYTPNRITLSYERLEFIGDAILDFLITCYIYESCGALTPGQMTDLRSALVNNNTFASLVVRNGFHKFLLMMNMTLQGHIDKFAEYLERKDYVIDDEVLILLEEKDFHLAEYIDVPKVLGDIFEAVAGAVYLDSGKDLKTVWRVFYKLMYQEIDRFSNNVPKNVIRKLYECTTAYPTFSKPVEVNNKKTMVALEFMCEGCKRRVFGFGTNKILARRAAAKIALRSLKL